MRPGFLLECTRTLRTQQEEGVPTLMCTDYLSAVRVGKLQSTGYKPVVRLGPVLSEGSGRRTYPLLIL